MNFITLKNGVMETLRVNVPGRIGLNQIGVVVKDLEEAIDYYSTRFGIGPFEISDRRNWEIIVCGEPKVINARIAMTDYEALNGVQFELIEVPEEETIYTEFVRTRGEGLHHLGFGVVDFEVEVAEWERQGFRVIQRSKPGAPRSWAYMDTDRVAGVIFELRKHAGMPPV